MFCICYLDSTLHTISLVNYIYINQQIFNYVSSSCIHYLNHFILRSVYRDCLKVVQARDPIYGTYIQRYLEIPTAWPPQAAIRAYFCVLATVVDGLMIRGSNGAMLRYGGKENRRSQVAVSDSAAIGSNQLENGRGK